MASSRAKSRTGVLLTTNRVGVQFLGETAPETALAQYFFVSPQSTSIRRTRYTNVRFAH